MNAVQSDLEYDTRRRLIEAASDIFIEQGYQTTKIRDIVKHAKANLAAINYHCRVPRPDHDFILDTLSDAVRVQRRHGGVVLERIW